MDGSFREQGSDREQDPKRSWVSLLIPLSIIKWLTSFIKLTEEEQEDAGICFDRRNDE